MKPRIGVSACLLGQPVRYDGGHKLQPWMSLEWAGRVDWVAVCPEVELGLGVPRETIQLEAREQGLALIATETRRDLTQAMRLWAAGRVEALAAEGFDGYVFKARSPSCGLGSAGVAGSSETRDGLFAEAVRARFPELPLEEDEALADAASAARFLRMAEAHRDLRALFQAEWTRGE
jgi:uncharacterized protein YbbK (DUF523 family)